MNYRDAVTNIWHSLRPDIKSMRELERAIGLSNGTISKWDKLSPSQKTFQKLADFFNITIDQIVEIKDSQAIFESLEKRRKPNTNQNFANSHFVHLRVLEVAERRGRRIDEIHEAVGFGKKYQLFDADYTFRDVENIANELSIPMWILIDDSLSDDEFTKELTDIDTAGFPFELDTLRVLRYKGVNLSTKDRVELSKFIEFLIFKRLEKIPK